MKKFFLFLCCSIAALSFKDKSSNGSDLVANNAAMPSVTKDAKGIIYIVFASGNKLEYVASSDNGTSFSKPVIVDTIKDLMGIAGRGPRITCTTHTLNILATDKAGNIHSYTKDEKGKWTKNGLVNDVPEVCKEGFVSVSAKGDSLYAVWLDLRNDKKTVAGSLSADGGRTWSKNKTVYESPSGHVCDCCSPSVAFSSNGINVMFRNNLNGNRNLYLTQSNDGGRSFGNARKLGNGNWKLDGCPMDGGGLVVNDKGAIQTVWRRMDTIYACAPNQPEVMIGKGKNCTIAETNNQIVYAWLEGNKIACLLPNGKKVNVGEGEFPVIKPINNNELICVWQNDNNVCRKIITL